MFPRNMDKVIIQTTLLTILANQSSSDNLELHKGLSVKSLTILSPDACDPNLEVDFLYMIHTAPTHFALRNTLRNSWATELSNPKKSRRVFLIGRSNATVEESIMEEHNMFGDIFMYDKIDAYRNMTIKVSISKRCHIWKYLQTFNITYCHLVLYYELINFCILAHSVVQVVNRMC